MSVFKKIRGTIETIFQVGLGGPNIKATGGALEARDATDAAYAQFRVNATPVGANDAASKSYVDGQVAGTDVVSVVRFTLDNSATQASTFQIPADSRVLRTKLDITTPYSAGATITIGHTGSATALMATTDNDAESANSYEIDSDTAWHTSASTVQVAVANTPAAGAGVVIVEYVESPDA